MELLDVDIYESPHHPKTVPSCSRQPAMVPFLSSPPHWQSTPGVRCEVLRSRPSRRRRLLVLTNRVQWPTSCKYWQFPEIDQNRLEQIISTLFTTKTKLNERPNQP